MATTRLKRLKQRKRIARISISLAGIAILIILVIFLARIWGFYNKIHTVAKTPGTQTKPVEKDEYTLLLLGYGGGKHEGTYLTDTIMLANIQLKKKEVTLVSIPRDIWVNVPTKNAKDPFHAKINSVYQMGLFPKDYPAVDTKYITEDNPSGLIKEVVHDITGMQVDGFIAVDFEGFTRVMDILGGIDVTVERSFTDYEYPIEGKEAETCDKKDQELEDALKEATKEPVLAFPCRFETLTFEKGATHMDGATALKYARSRHSLDDGGDFNRAKRQQNVLEATKEKILSIGFISKIIPLLDELEQHIKTDVDLSVMNKLLLEARNANDYKRKTFVIEGKFITDSYSEYGQYIIIPSKGIDRWDDIKTEINNIRKDITPTPSVRPTKKVTPTKTK
ncbi:hypothetical protein BH09PAT2_BH09PAT2_09130 [soil metagenome]